MGYSRKIQTEGGEGGGLRIWNFQAYQYIKEIANVISKGDQEKIMWNFLWSLFLALEFPRDLTQLFGISRGLALFCLEFPGLKLKN